MPSIPFNSEKLTNIYLLLHPENFSGTDAQNASTIRRDIDTIRSARNGKLTVRIPTDICRKAERLVPGIFSEQ